MDTAESHNREVRGSNPVTAHYNEWYDFAYNMTRLTLNRLQIQMIGGKNKLFNTVTEVWGKFSFDTINKRGKIKI